MTGDGHVPFRGSLGVKLPGATRLHNLNSIGHDFGYSDIVSDERCRLIPSPLLKLGEGDGSDGLTVTEPLGEYCSLLKGRNRKVHDSGGAKVVPASAIHADLTIDAWNDLPYSDPIRRNSVWVEPGDIIGSISPPYGRWALVPAEYRPALASDHTVVLKKASAVSMRYILEFLQSERAREVLRRMCRGSVIQRLDVDELRKLPVPKCPLDCEYVDSILRAYRQELVRLGGEIDSLTCRLSDAFNGVSPFELSVDIDALHGVAMSIKSVEKFNDGFRIARASYPYPIARSVRAIERTLSPRERYHEVVHTCLETISMILTSFSIAVARKVGIRGRPVKTWVGHLYRSGSTIGGQRSVFAEIARSLASEGDQLSDVGGIGRTLGDSNSPALTLFRTLLAERNRIHGDYPRSDFEFDTRLIRAEASLRELLDRLSFLARWELRYAHAVEPVEGPDGLPDFIGQFAVLKGDNPDWSFAEYVSDEPLYRDRVYAFVDGSELIDLHPFLLVRDCPQCGSKEVYYPDSIDEEQVNLKSLDRGHSQVASDLLLLRQLRNACDQIVGGD